MHIKIIIFDSSYVSHSQVVFRTFNAVLIVYLSSMSTLDTVAGSSAKSDFYFLMY